jgi:hypothetical protein
MNLLQDRINKIKMQIKIFECKMPVWHDFDVPPSLGEVDTAVYVEPKPRLS